MTVRPLTSEEVPELAELLAELALLRRYDRSAAAIDQALHRALERNDRLVVFDDGRPVGLAWFLTAGTFGIGGYLRLIAVAESAQRRGIGSELLAAFEAATRVDSDHAFLLVSDYNHDAQRFYRRAGYQPVGELPGLVLSDVGEMIFWKRLVC